MFKQKVWNMNYDFPTKKKQMCYTIQLLEIVYYQSYTNVRWVAEYLITFANIYMYYY